MLLENGRSTSDYTVDYVKIKLPDGIKAKEMEEMALGKLVENICDHLKLDYNCYGTKPNYNTYIKSWEYLFSVWGPAAEVFHDHMISQDYHSIIRLDIRLQLKNEHIDYRHLFALIEARSPKRGSVTRRKSPLRKKIHGRDVGGDSVRCGGDGSEQALTTYNRGEEPAAVELQLKGRKLKGIIAKALGQDIPENYRANDMVKAALCQELEDLVRTKTGYTISEIEAWQEVPEVNQLPESQEERLEQLDFLWENLDDEAKDSFIVAHIEELAEVPVTARQVPDAIAQQIISGHELDEQERYFGDFPDEE